MFWLVVSKIKKFFHFDHSKQMLLVTVLLFAIVFSVIKLLWAATPDPGHYWSGAGDGTFAVTGPTVARTYTFPDASATVLTTSSLVSVAQGGTGTSSLTGVLIGNGTSALTATTSPDGLLVGTTASQTLTGKTINASDNTLYCGGGGQLGYLLYSDGTKFLCRAYGEVGEFLRTNAAGTDIEWAAVSSGPAGSDTQLQYNNSGSFGASSSLTWSQANKSLNLSNYLSLSTTTLPSVASTGTIKIFNQKVSGREMLNYRSDQSSDYGFFQPSLYQNMVTMIGTGSSGSVTSIGTGALTSDGPGAHVGFQETGYRMTFIPGVTSTPKYISNTDAFYYRGSVDGRNGYFFFARVFTDARGGGTAYWAGLTDRSGTVALAADNPVGSRSGFAFSDGLSETNWMFSNRAGGTENRTSTGIAMAADTVYDLYFYNAPRGSVVTWRIDDLTNSTTAEGSSSTALPTSSVAMRSVVGVRCVSSCGYGIGLQKLYVEVPR